MIRFPLSLLFSWLNNNSSLSLLIAFVLQTLHQPCGPCLDAFEYLSILPKLGVPKQDTALKVGPHIAEYRGTITALVLLATLLLTQAWMPLAFLATWAQLAHVQSAMSANPGPFLPGCCTSTLLQGIVVAKVQDLALGFVKPHIIGFYKNYLKWLY